MGVAYRRRGDASNGMEMLPARGGLRQSRESAIAENYIEPMIK
jgi:hypothetical protein